MSKYQTENKNNRFERLKDFIFDNQKSLTVIGSIIIGLVLVFTWYQYVYIPGKENEAQNQMFKAEYYFDTDSLSKAIDGDGSYPGFKQIVEEYGNTKSGNLAQYYLGICYLKTGKFEQAIEHLTSFNGSDAIFSTMALGASGDAYSELKQYDKAIVFYKKAIDKVKNSFTAPMYLKKLALVYEELKDFKSALESYEKIKTEYSDSEEAKSIETYIARAEAQI